MKNWILPIIDQAKAPGPFSARLERALEVLAEAERDVRPGTIDFTARVIESVGESKKNHDFASALAREIPLMVHGERLAQLRAASPIIHANTPDPSTMPLVMHELDNESTRIVRANDETLSPLVELPPEVLGGLPAAQRVALARRIAQHLSSVSLPPRSIRPSRAKP
jgi:hypothetical protein